MVISNFSVFFLTAYSQLSEVIVILVQTEPFLSAFFFLSWIRRLSPTHTHTLIATQNTTTNMANEKLMYKYRGYLNCN